MGPQVHSRGGAQTIAMSCVAVSAADPSVGDSPRSTMKPPGLASVSSTVSRSNGRPCQVHALNKLTSVLNFEGDAVRRRCSIRSTYRLPDCTFRYMG